jgi:hypothetical protein
LLLLCTPRYQLCCFSLLFKGFPVTDFSTAWAFICSPKVRLIVAKVEREEEDSGQLLAVSVGECPLTSK